MNGKEKKDNSPIKKVEVKKEQTTAKVAADAPVANATVRDIPFEDRVFCGAAGGAGRVTAYNTCAFDSSATKRLFLAKKGFYIPDVKSNLQDLTFFEAAVAAGDIIPLTDGTVSEVTPNVQIGQIGIQSAKISDGETNLMYKVSVVGCLLSEYAKLDSNSSAYDMYVVSSTNKLTGKYDNTTDRLYPIAVNSIFVTGKPIGNDGTTIDNIFDTLQINYNGAESKAVSQFAIPDSVANIRGLREALVYINSINSAANTMNVKVVSRCEGDNINDLTATDGSDFSMTYNGLPLDLLTQAGGATEGAYNLTYDSLVDVQPGDVLTSAINAVASNNESFSNEFQSYTMP